MESVPVDLTRRRRPDHSILRVRSSHRGIVKRCVGVLTTGHGFFEILHKVVDTEETADRDRHHANGDDDVQPRLPIGLTVLVHL